MAEGSFLNDFDLTVTPSLPLVMLICNSAPILSSSVRSYIPQIHIFRTGKQGSCLIVKPCHRKEP